MSAKKILVMNGPNLDMLGMREPEIYGTETLGNLEYEIQRYGETRGVEVVCYQSNHEGKLIAKIHRAMGKYDGIIYNPGAHTHYSYALRDAVASIDVPVVEVHLSDIETREAFRRVSVIAPACIAQVRGMGVNGYRCALDLLCEGNKYQPLGEGFTVPAGENIVIGAEVGDGEAALSYGDNNGEAALGDAGDAPDADDGAPVKEASPEAFGAAASESASSEASAVSVENPNTAALSAERQAAIATECARLGIAGLLLRDTSNIRWATAFDNIFDEEPAHALLVAGDLAILHTDSRYSNAVRAEIERTGSSVCMHDERMTHSEFAKETLSAEGTPSGKLGFEDTITYSEFVKMVDSFTSAGLAPTTDLVKNLRAVKSAAEIERLKATQKITDAAFSHIITFMRPGMTEREVQLELEDYLLHHGAEELAFRSIVAAGAHSADPHAVPSDARLESGQCVVLDFGAKANGYCSDMTRTVFLGEPDAKMTDAWKTLCAANEAVELMLRPGVTGAEAHQIAEGVLAEGGFGGKMGHGVGHGVGLDVHELPMLNPRNEKPLREGNVVTVEPGIYLPGEFGMRLEDFGVITPDGFEVFTHSTHDLVVL